MASVTYSVTEFAKHLTAGGLVDMKRVKDAMTVAARAGIGRIEQEMKAPTEPRGDGKPSYKTVGVNGIYFKGWQVRRTPSGCVLFNDVPYASIIELGTRIGHRMNPAVLYRWIIIKLGASLREPMRWRKEVLGEGHVMQTRVSDPMWFEKEVQRVAFAIARNIRRRGIYPRFILRNSLPDVTRQMGKDIKTLLASGPARG